MAETIEFIDYEGLQIRYEREEIITVPLEITLSKKGDFGESFLPTYWLIDGERKSISPYHVMWRNLGNRIEVEYREDDRYNEMVAAKAKECGWTVFYGKETYILKDGIVTQVLWRVKGKKGKPTYDSKINTTNLKFEYPCPRKRTSHVYNHVDRKQKEFRDKLLREYKKCAISKTTFEPVLEAAHVLDVVYDGNERIDNGILLRADLHILFDRGLLKIGDNGVVRISKKAKEYQQYNGVKIDEKILKRIKNNLKKKNAKKSGK